MGCVVNGLEEAREADVALPAARDVAIFKKGEIVRTVSEEAAVDELMKEIDSMLD